MVAFFSAHGITRKELFRDYLMIEIPAVMKEMSEIDAMRSARGLSMFGGVSSSASVGGYDYLKNQELDVGGLEHLRMLTGGSA